MEQSGMEIGTVWNEMEWTVLMSIHSLCLIIDSYFCTKCPLFQHLEAVLMSAPTVYCFLIIFQPNHSFGVFNQST